MAVPDQQLAVLCLVYPSRCRTRADLCYLCHLNDRSTSSAKSKALSRASRQHAKQSSKQGAAWVGYCGSLMTFCCDPPPPTTTTTKFPLPLSTAISTPTSRFWSGVVFHGLGLVSWSKYGKCSECNYILYNVLSDVCQFEEPSSLFQQDSASINKAGLLWENQTWLHAAMLTVFNDAMMSPWPSVKVFSLHTFQSTTWKLLSSLSKLQRLFLSCCLPIAPQGHRKLLKPKWEVKPREPQKMGAACV